MTISKFYTLDRLRCLSEGQRIEFSEPFCPIVPLQEHVASRFSSGVSAHANNYFFNYHINLMLSEERLSATIEMLLEERRRSSFPDKPSRFQSLFACESIKEAAWFRGSSKSPIDTPIFEIHTDSTWHKGDMNLLNINCSPVELSHRLDLYWQGETYNQQENYFPFWEILIPLPTLIFQRIIE